jgi:chorismate mutase
VTDATPTDAEPDGLAAWRSRIDAIDRALVALLNARAACAAEIGRIKHAAGLPVYAPRREEDVLGNVVEANGGPLPPQAVRRLFERIIDETRSLEREMTERDGDDGDTAGGEPPAPPHAAAG